MTNSITKIHIVLLDEGTDPLKSVPAESLGNDIYRLLPDRSYSTDLENWEFLPGAIVRAEMRPHRPGEILLVAFEQLEPPPYASNIFVLHMVGKEQSYKLRKAISLGKHIYKLLPEADGTALAGTWEFPDHAILQCEDGYWNRRNLQLDDLVAVERVGYFIQVPSPAPHAPFCGRFWFRFCHNG